MRAYKYGYKEYTRQDVINYYSIYDNEHDKLIWMNVKHKIGYRCDFLYEHKPEKAKKVVIYTFARN